MALELLSFTRTWLSSEDFPTIEPDETKVREDLQFHPDSIKKYLNQTIVPALDDIIENGVKCPNALVFSGAVTARYDGDEEVHVDIPVGSGGGATATVTVSCSVDSDGTTVTFGDLPTGYVNAFTLASDAYKSGQTVQLALTNGAQQHSLYLAKLSATGGAEFVGYRETDEGIGVIVVTIKPEGDGKYAEAENAKPIIGTAPPTTSTVGSVGQQYIDKTNKRVWYCTAAEATGYTWILTSAGLSTKVNATLSASGWNAAKKYTLSNSNITATSAVELLPRENNGITQAQMEALSGAMIVGGTQAAGSIQLVALGDVPTIDIPVTIIIRRDL